jgi:nicotinate-nucleotide adenylyltransferase
LRVGIYGGTFDPVHRGHTYIANQVLRLLALDRVLLMVSRLPPHKPGNGVAAQHHRLAMVALETLPESHLYASGFELRRRGPSYTVQTMALLRERYPRHRFCFIGGSDSLREIHIWKNHSVLLRDNCCVFVQRAGARVDTALFPEIRLEKVAAGGSSSPEIRPGSSFLVDIGAPDISSSQVRESLAGRGRPLSGEISPKVLQYIRKYHLYEDNKRIADPGL